MVYITHLSDSTLFGFNPILAHNQLGIPCVILILLASGLCKVRHGYEKHKHGLECYIAQLLFCHNEQKNFFDTTPYLVYCSELRQISKIFARIEHNKIKCSKITTD